MENNRALSLANNDDFDSMDQRDRILPRLKIMQGLSKEVQDGLFRAGMLVDVTGKRLIGDIGKQVNVTHLMFYKEWIEFNPKTGCPKNEMILGRSTDANSKLALMAADWNANKIQTLKGERQRVTAIYNFILTIPEVTESWEQLFVFSYMKTGHKVGKQLLNRMDVLRMKDPATGENVKARIWAYQWLMGAKEDVNADGQKYYVPFLGNCTLNTEETWAGLLDMSNSLKGMRAKIEEQITAGHEAEAAGGAEEGAASIKNAEM